MFNSDKQDRLLTNTPIDNIIDGLESGIVTNIYGPGGSGKTNVMICAALSAIGKGKKVVYIDTENNFSIERFQQLNGTQNDLNKILFLTPTSWKEQIIAIDKLFDKVKKSDIGLIIVDSMVSLYRLEISDENFRDVNKQLAKQFSILTNVAKALNVPILVTSQVYAKKDETGKDSVEITSNSIARFWSKTMIELQPMPRSGHRLAILRRHRSKPENMKIEFIIQHDRLKPVGKFSLF